MALAADKKTEYREGVEIAVPVYQATKIYAGALVCVNAAGYLVPGADTAGLIFMGWAREYVDNSLGLDGALTALIRRRGLVKMTLATAITAANVGDNVFLADDESVDLAGNVTNDIFCGIIAEYIDTTHAWVDIEPAIRQADVATHIADTSGAHAASAISILDSGTFTAAAQVEAALAELYQDLKSTQKILNIPLGSFTELDGTPLAKFADGADPTPGFSLNDSKGFGIRWNNHANPDPIATSIPIPPDLDGAANAVLHVLASKSGATVGDAVTFTCQAFNLVPAALHDADTDFGGVSSAMTGDATAKTLAELTLTLALADVVGAPGAITLSLQPTDGTLGTDDVTVYAVWIEYKGLLLTA